MSDRNADIAEHGGVGEVALESADGQLSGEELEYGVSHAEVALTVLVVDWVDFMWHCA